MRAPKSLTIVCFGLLLSKNRTHFFALTTHTTAHITKIPDQTVITKRTELPRAERAQGELPQAQISPIPNALGGFSRKPSETPRRNNERTGHLSTEQDADPREDLSVPAKTPPEHRARYPVTAFSLRHKISHSNQELEREEGCHTQAGLLTTNQSNQKTALPSGRADY